MRAPDTLVTSRLTLRRPALADAPAIFARYAADPEVTRWLGWSRHQSVDDALAFVRWSDQAWVTSPGATYLAHERATGRLCGSTGLVVEAPWRATTGYVLARDAWGVGYATELARAMVELADALRIVRLAAVCHVDHRASARVLARAGFAREGVLRAHTWFPNLEPPGLGDVESWARIAPR